MSEWRDISTAPKDGDNVLLFVATCESASPQSHIYLVAYWNDVAWECCETGKTSDRGYTHWMPLPSPPEKENT